jgi:hypothetical protein
MFSGPECRQQAVICREMLSSTDDHVTQSALQNMARTWTVLANQTDKYDARLAELRDG